MMRMICLCPTYGRPRQLLENTLACFATQDYKGPHELWLLDDGNTVASQPGGRLGASWSVVNRHPRHRSLPDKYNDLLRRVGIHEDVGYVVWDDDDLYLPWHLSSYAETLQRSEWVHPVDVWSTYDSLHREKAAGRFHGSLAIRGDLLRRIGGWIETRRADFDQQQIAECARLAACGRPDYDPSYVFRWQDSGANHCQGLMTSPDNLDWYDRVRRSHYSDDGAIGILEPQFDAAAKKVYEQLGVKANVKQAASEQPGGNLPELHEDNNATNTRGNFGGKSQAPRSSMQLRDEAGSAERAKKLRRIGHL